MFFDKTTTQNIFYNFHNIPNNDTHCSVCIANSTHWISGWGVSRVLLLGVYLFYLKIF